MIDYADMDSEISYEDRVSYIRKHNPDMTEDDAQSYLSLMIHRREKKQELLNRGFSNRLAEHWLDRAQMPRPWGWHSVFYYPDSNRPRTRYVVIVAVVLAYFIWRGLHG